MSPNPICHPSSLWIYLFAEYRKSTRQVKGVVLYTLQLQKWREQWWLVTTVCEWGKEKLQIWSWGSLSTFKWWLYKYSCSRTTGPVFGIERGNSSLTACQKQLFSHKLLFSRRYNKAVLCQAELKDIGMLGCFDWLLNRKVKYVRKIVIFSNSLERYADWQHSWSWLRLQDRKWVQSPKFQYWPVAKKLLVWSKTKQNSITLHLWVVWRIF